MEDLGGNTQIVKDCGASVPSSFSPVLLFVTLLEWIAISFSRGSSHPGIKSGSPALQAES